MAERIDDWLVRAFEGRSTLEAAAGFVPRRVAELHGLQAMLDGFVKATGGRQIDGVRRGPISSIVTVSFAAREGVDAGALECVLDDDGLFLGFQSAPAGVDIEVAPADALSPGQLSGMHELFDVAYEAADGEYLDRSLTRLGWVSMAFAADDDARLVGFSLGDVRTLDLPSIGPTPTMLAGLACVDPERRRHGLFRYLSNLSLRAAGLVSPDRRALGAGRMAHPASMRIFAVAPTLVPRPGRRPSPLQQAVGQTVAEAYGVAGFDPATFVCRGSGRPIGFPRMTQEVEAHEWEVFEPVDRDRGDSLLALIWHGEAPDGW
ncbi:MAG TPA: hypothetical protein VM143_17890 [Acidimicrobiales bacterium]|nr:hypothetical protein [Acidimicrobiales bacterium]